MARIAGTSSGAVALVKTASTATRTGVMRRETCLRDCSIAGEGFMGG